MQDTTLALAVALPTGGISLLVLLAITCMKRKNSDSTGKGAKATTRVSTSSSTAPLTSVTSVSDSGALFGDKSTRNPLFDDDDVSLRRMSSAGSVQQPPPAAAVASSDVIMSVAPLQQATPANDTPVPESAPIVDAPAPSAEDRAARLAAMRASRATKKVNEVTIIQEALRVLDMLDE